MFNLDNRRLNRVLIVSCLVGYGILFITLPKARVVVIMPTLIAFLLVALSTSPLWKKPKYWMMMGALLLLHLAIWWNIEIPGVGASIGLAIEPLDMFAMMAVLYATVADRKLSIQK